MEQNLGPLGRLLLVLSIRNRNKAALAAKDRSAHLNMLVHLVYVACYSLREHIRQTMIFHLVTPQGNKIVFEM